MNGVPVGVGWYVVGVDGIGIQNLNEVMLTLNPVAGPVKIIVRMSPL